MTNVDTYLQRFSNASKKLACRAHQLPLAHAAEDAAEDEREPFLLFCFPKSLLVRNTS